MCLRLKAIDGALPLLIAVLRHNSDLIVQLSQTCQEYGILTGPIHSDTTETKEERVLYFVHDIWTTLKIEDDKRTTFIQVLKRHKSFHHIYKQIKTDIKEFKAEQRAFYTPIQEVSPKIDLKSTSTMVGGNPVIPKLGLTSLDEYYYKEMDTNQYIAIIEDLRIQIHVLQKERQQLTSERGKAQQKKS